jgi:hypothetical protein
MIGAILAGVYGDVAPQGDFESIATATVGSGGSSFVEFTSISQNYQHLQIRFLAQAGSVGMNVQLNGSTSGYAVHYLYGDGSTVTAGAGTGEIYMFAGRLPTANHYGVGVIDLLDYSNANKNTTLRSLAGNDQNGSGSVWLYSGLYPSTTVVSSIKILPTTGNFSQYSHFALYGIKG